MRIGNSDDLLHDNTGKSVAKDTKRAGPAATVAPDKAVAALDAYEDHQRRGFEAIYWDKPDAWLRRREGDVSRTTDGTNELRVRRQRAELFAIRRILKRRVGDAR